MYICSSVQSMFQVEFHVYIVYKTPHDQDLYGLRGCCTMPHATRPHAPTGAHRRSRPRGRPGASPRSSRGRVAAGSRIHCIICTCICIPSRVKCHHTVRRITSDPVKITYTKEHA